MRLRNPEALVVALAIGCGSGGPPAVVTTAAAPLTATPTATPVAITSGPVRVAYREDWFGGADLLGVDAAHAKAVVRLDGKEPDRVYVDTIDLATGVRAARWEVTEPGTQRAIAGTGFPPGDAMRSDILRLASLLAPLGPWHTRVSLPSPTFATSTSHDVVLYGSPATSGASGDWILAIDASGNAPRRVDEGLTASYSPVLSPSGVAAFRGCNSSPCNYGVFVAEANARPRRIGGISSSSPPVFTNDGTSVLAMGDGPKEARCLFKAKVASSAPASSLFCLRGASSVSFSEDKEGRTAIVSGVRGIGATQILDLHWVLLEDGSSLGEATVARGTGGGIVSENGLVAVPMQRGGLAIVDLVAHKQAVMPDDGGWFSGFDASAFS